MSYKPVSKDIRLVSNTQTRWAKKKCLIEKRKIWQMLSCIYKCGHYESYILYNWIFGWPWEYLVKWTQTRFSLEILSFHRFALASRESRLRVVNPPERGIFLTIPRSQSKEWQNNKSWYVLECSIRLFQVLLKISVFCL